MTLIRIVALTVAATALASTDLHAQTAMPGRSLAVAFGAQESSINPELSPDGKLLVYIGPGPGPANVVHIVDVATGKSKPVAWADGKPMRLTGCGWSAPDRLVCSEFGLVRAPGAEANLVPHTRLFALDPDGKNMLALGRQDGIHALYGRQFDGHIIDWRDGSDGKLLMTRYYVPEMSTGRHTASTDEGYGVDLVDTRRQHVTRIEPPKENTHFWSDGRSVVRMMARQEMGSQNQLTGNTIYYYRMPGDQKWHELARDTSDEPIEPLAVDSGRNAAYVLKPLDGRRALYRIGLDGTLKTELVFAHPQVDVENVVTIGRTGRVVGASYATDRPHVEYFDDEYRKLAASFSRALPRLPLIRLVSADAAERVLLISASSDDDAGHYYVYERDKRQLAELLLARPALATVKLARMKAVEYAAADGTRVPAYLTLPPGVENARDIPAIVLPHGGPAARDVWGFDWLAQYYATHGFAVLQPNFRGSAGYGSEWFVRNGFKSWKIAVGDVIDGGRWLVAQGIADPRRLGIVGWSYGGYAALQANVVDPDLFKAVVAIAPVTDLDMLKNERRGFTSDRLRRNYIGAGAHIEEGSPARHAARFKAPVLLFHGERDANVSVAESKAMDKALTAAGKSSQLLVYPDLDHQLHDNVVRGELLQKSYDFLMASMK